MVDIDQDIDLKELCKLYPVLGDTCCKRGNSKGYHFYFRNKELSNLKTEIKCLKGIEGDVITGDVWEAVDCKFNHNIVSDITNHDLKNLFIDDKRWNRFLKIDVIKTELTKNNIKFLNNKSLLQLLDIITTEYLDNRADWVRIVLACKGSGVSIEKAKEISKKSDRYEEEGFDKVWETYDNGLITATSGTIHYFAKLSNPVKYENITCSDKIIKLLRNNLTDCGLSKFYLSLKDKSLVYCDNQCYIYNNNNWIIIDKKTSGILRSDINETLNNKFELFKEYLFSNSDIEKRDELFALVKNALNKVNTTTSINNIKTEVFSMLESTGYDKEDIFDKLPYVFCFNNVAFDLETNNAIKVKQEMYITQRTKYNYEKPTKEQLDLIDELFNKIFPDEEVKKCYLSIMYSALTGIRPEKFILANGDGRNGKGLLNELLFELLGDYAYKLPIEFLTKKSTKSTNGSANPMLSACDKKRFILSSEPEDNASLNMAIIKDLTGSNIIKARDLYCSQSNVNMLQTSLLECNKKPSIDGRLDNSVLERIVDCPFVSTFTSFKEQVDEKNNIYLANTDYKKESWKKEHRCALFKYILENGKKELYIPPVIVERSKSYVLASDDLYSWITQYYRLVDDMNKFEKVKDIFNLYKSSEYYTNLNKKQKRDCSKTKFTERIQKHIAFKKRFKDDTARINNMLLNCERIHGLEFIEESEDEDEIDDEIDDDIVEM